MQHLRHRGSDKGPGCNLFTCSSQQRLCWCPLHQGATGSSGEEQRETTIPMLRLERGSPVLFVPSSFIFTAYSRCLESEAQAQFLSVLPPGAARGSVPWPSAGPGLLLTSVGWQGQITVLVLGSCSTDSSAAPSRVTLLCPSSKSSCGAAWPSSSLPSATRACVLWRQPGLGSSALLRVVSQCLGLPACVTPGPSRAAPYARKGGKQGSAQVGGTGLPLNPRLPEDGVLAQTHPCADFTSSRSCCSKSGVQERGHAAAAQVPAEC